MSDEARARHAAREVRIWRPFAYSFPFTSTETEERIVIFGLYANTYLNGQSYLKQIEDAELENLLTDYNTRMSGLTVQGQIVVADIVSKRYLAGIDKLIHDQKMETGREKIATDSAIADAKYAALESDRAALETMSAKIAASIQKNNARITELEAQISIEGINYTLVEQDIAEKELQSLRIDNRKLDVANEIIRIQIQTVRTATELLDIEVQKARTEINISDTERAIAKIGLLADDLTIEKAQTAIIESEIPVSKARVALAQAKYDDADAELTYIQTTLMDNEDTIRRNKEDLLTLRANIKEYALDRSESEKLLANENRRDLYDLEKDLATDDKINQADIDTNITIPKIAAGARNDWSRANAAIEVAENVAKAEIATKLTHVIQKAT
jgi:chromosome segregation ATPase